MKRQDKNFKEQINKTLAPLDAQNPLPKELEKENIEKVLENIEVIKLNKEKESTKKNSKRMVPIIAAAVVLVLGIFVFKDVIKNNVPTENTGSKSGELESVKSYDGLETMFIQMQKNAQTENDRFSFRNFLYGVSGNKSSDMATEQNSATKESAQSNSADTDDAGYSKTNTQVSGVDEADILKNDGQYLYIVQRDGDAVTIVKALPAGEMKLSSTIKMPEECRVSDIYVYKNTLVAICSEENAGISGATKGGAEIATYDSVYPQGSMTTVITYDITDKLNPKQIKSYTQDGDCTTTRLINDKLYVVSNYSVYLYQEKSDMVKNCVPTTSIDSDKAQRIPVSDISIMPNNETPSYLVVCGIDLSDKDKEPSKKAVLGGSAEAYCTTESLYAARVVYSYSGYKSTCKTEIYSFSLNNGSVEFKNKGEVEGYFLNQFSMDEHNGYFRVATTNEDTQQGSNVFVLNEKLEIVGEIREIAKKETIYAVRFIGDKGYVVTFERTDPLFIIDLKNPKAPKITGELKIPGFSNYLHPYSDNLLIGIGRNGNENGELNGLKISLFDISDDNNPKEIDSFVINDAYSEAQYNSRAYMTSGKSGFFGIPISIYGVNGGYEFRFDMFTVENNKLKLMGKYKNYESSKYSTEYDGLMEVRRGAYIGDNIYVISDSRIRAFSISTSEMLGNLNIDVINR